MYVSGSTITHLLLELKMAISIHTVEADAHEALSRKGVCEGEGEGEGGRAADVVKGEDELEEEEEEEEGEDDMVWKWS